MSKKLRRKSRQRKRQAPPRQTPWHLVAFVAAAILLAIAGLVMLEPWSSEEPQVTPQMAGTPRLKVEQNTIDEGYIKYDVPIRTTFKLSNIGDQSLKIVSEPQVRLVKGC